VTSERVRRLPLGAEVALGFAAGLASFGAIATILAATQSDAVAVILGAACLAAVVAIARSWGIGYAAPAGIAALVAYDWFKFPPTHPHDIPSSEDLLALFAYVAVATLIGELAASSIRRARESESARSALAAEQAALRRVATLVARGVAPEEVFAAVARELGELLGVDAAHLGRYGEDGITIGVGSWSRTGDALPAQASVEGDNVTARVLQTRCPARVVYAAATGELAGALRDLGFRSSVGAPIVVDGRLWGVLVASSKDDRPLPPDTEARIEEFTGLVATAISNVQARGELAASRARVVAAADDERRRVVRDLHDGAQQRLVHTVITLKLARDALDRADAEATTLIGQALDEAKLAHEELRELAHGILPTVLTRGGLRAGVDALAGRVPLPVDVDVPVGRLPPTIEATAYFVVAEALTNVAKHARAHRAAVAAVVEDSKLRITVRDDGVGGARRDGTGLLGLADRLAALDGRLSLEAPAEGGTVVVATIPLPD
jgi:signal transduction histidine kinase